MTSTMIEQLREWAETLDAIPRYRSAEELIGVSAGMRQVADDLEARPSTVWAAFAGNAGGGNGIGLHPSELDALLDCCASLGFGEDDRLEEWWESGQSDEDICDRLRTELDEHCSNSADDWHVQEVEIP